MNDILDKIQKICRVCLLEQPLMFSLHHKSYSNKNVHDMLLTCTTINVEINDNLPQLVCNNCLTRLETAYLFKEECEKSDKTLRKIILENSNNFDSKFDLTIVKNESDNEVNVSSVVKVEISVDEDDEIKIKNEIDPEFKYQSSEIESDSSDGETLHELKKKLIKYKKNSKDQNIKVKRLKQRHENYECQTCKKAFRHHKRFWKHREEHLYFSCYICFKQLPDIEALDKHYQEHPSKTYICNEQDCEKEFDNYRLFLLHKKNDHNVLNYLQCSECDKSFSCHEQWDIHIQKYLSNPFKCEKCDLRFPTKKSFHVHIRVHPDYYKCDICSKTFTSSKNLVRHKSVHKRTPFICEECGKKFSQHYLLSKHIDVVHKGLPAEKPKRAKTQLCPYCGQCFRRPTDLTCHIRTHTGSKPFACDKCDYRCHNKNLLRSHIRSHTGARPYTCEFCGKAFATRSYLTIHIRFHTGYRPYKCSYSPCEKGFTNSKDLKVHERTHTGIKHYHCTICSNSFTTLHYLKVHTKKHENQ